MGDVNINAQYAQRRSVYVERYATVRLHPTEDTIGAEGPILQDEVRPITHGSIGGVAECASIIRMNELKEGDTRSLLSDASASVLLRSAAFCSSSGLGSRRAPRNECTYLLVASRGRKFLVNQVRVNARTPPDSFTPSPLAHGRIACRVQ
jgi:hypothetical protein